MPPDYGQNFDLIYLKADNSLAAGNHEIIVKVSSENWQKNSIITFTHENETKSNLPVLINKLNQNSAHNPEAISTLFE